MHKGAYCPSATCINLKLFLKWKSAVFILRFGVLQLACQTLRGMHFFSCTISLYNSLYNDNKAALPLPSKVNSCKRCSSSFSEILDAHVASAALRQIRGLALSVCVVRCIKLFRCFPSSTTAYHGTSLFSIFGKKNHSIDLSSLNRIISYCSQWAHTIHVSYRKACIAICIVSWSKCVMTPLLQR